MLTGLQNMTETKQTATYHLLRIEKKKIIELIIYNEYPDEIKVNFSAVIGMYFSTWP